MKQLDDYLYYEEKDPDLRIYCGDCLEIMNLIDVPLDLILTSPPYNKNGFRGKKDQSRGEGRWKRC